MDSTKLKSEEQLINEAITDVKNRFGMLDSWNVGADTTPEAFVKEVAKTIMRNSNQQAVEYSLHCVTANDFVIQVDTQYNSRTGERDSIMGLDNDAVTELKEDILNDLKLSI